MKPTIEDIKVNLDELKILLEGTIEKKRQYLIRQYCGGFCTRCMDIPSKKLSYDVGGDQLIEFYCGKCFRYRNEGRSKRDLDRLGLRRNL